MLTIVAFVVVLGPLILLHELGHFVGAKLTGVRVEEFGLGWPPRLFKIWQSPSRLVVGTTAIVAPRNFKLPSNLQTGQHVDVIAARKGGDAPITRSLRILDTKKDDLTPKHEISGEDVHIRGELTGLDLGTAYTVNWIPLGGFCRMTGEEDPGDPGSLAAQPKRERLLVLLAGPLTNLVAAIMLFSIAFLSGIPEPTATRVTILDVSPGSPAAEANLQPGDAIHKADGVAIRDKGELVDYINAHPGQIVVLTIERDGIVFEQPVRVRAESRQEGRVGITIVDQGYSFVTRRSSVLAAVGQGLDQFWFSVKQMLSLPALLIRGQVSPQEVKPLGPLGISQMAGDAIERSNEEQSWFTVLFFAGVISMALGITNLLPLPALDGGRITFVLIEAVRGRRIDPAKEGVVHLIGMALLLGLMLFMTIQELINPVKSPFG
jgi:regulator of sigma E protease